MPSLSRVLAFAGGANLLAEAGPHFPQLVKLDISYTGTEFGRPGGVDTPFSSDGGHSIVDRAYGPSSLALIPAKEPGEAGVAAVKKWDGVQMALRSIASGTEAGALVQFSTGERKDAAGSHNCAFRKQNAKTNFEQQLGFLLAFFEVTEDEGLRPLSNAMDEWQELPAGGDWSYAAQGKTIADIRGPAKTYYKSPQECKEICDEQEGDRSCHSLQVATDENDIPERARLRVCLVQGGLYYNTETIFKFKVEHTLPSADEREKLFTLYPNTGDEQSKHWSYHCHNADERFIAPRRVYSTPEKCATAHLSLSTPPNGEGDSELEHERPQVKVTLSQCESQPDETCQSGAGACIAFVDKELEFDRSNWNVYQYLDFRYLKAGKTDVCWKAYGGGYNLKGKITVQSCEQGIVGSYCCPPGQKPNPNALLTRVTALPGQSLGAAPDCVAADDTPAAEPIQECQKDHEPNPNHDPTKPWFDGELRAIPGDEPQAQSKGGRSWIFVMLICIAILAAVAFFVLAPKDPAGGSVRTVTASGSSEDPGVELNAA